ncbi:hypothetical protein, partial [Chamaesiphon sp. OTE_20_metabat_361]|uniref:hypothetical protein n=1 Tax=Chamaesiphon sp. OTE_20_metabat_361 TaxID=2964689 RepID=UPI00286C275D
PPLKAARAPRVPRGFSETRQAERRLSNSPAYGSICVKRGAALIPFWILVGSYSVEILLTQDLYVGLKNETRAHPTSG